MEIDVEMDDRKQSPIHASVKTYFVHVCVTV